MSTRAIKWLQQRKIPFEIVSYTHEVKGAAFAAAAANFPLAQTIKTLVTELGGGGCALALMPGDRQLSLKKLAQVLGVKKAVMAAVDRAERLTGYHVGGISPFGLRQALPAVMEERLLDYDQVLINGGQRGLLLKLDPGDIAAALKCRLSSLIVD